MTQGHLAHAVNAQALKATQGHLLQATGRVCLCLQRSRCTFSLRRLQSHENAFFVRRCRRRRCRLRSSRSRCRIRSCHLRRHCLIKALPRTGSALRYDESFVAQFAVAWHFTSALPIVFTFAVAAFRVAFTSALPIVFAFAVAAFRVAFPFSFAVASPIFARRSRPRDGGVMAPAVRPINELRVWYRSFAVLCNPLRVP